jgi:hypothetical protein
MYPMVDQELSRQAELEARRAGVRARRLHALEAYAGAKAVPDVEVGASAPRWRSRTSR